MGRFLESGQGRGQAVQDAGVSGDDGEQVVEVVGYPMSQLSDQLEMRGLAAACLLLLHGGHVTDQDEGHAG